MNWRTYIIAAGMLCASIGVTGDLQAQFGGGSPPDPGPPPSKTNPPLGGGSAPVGSGTLILLSLGAAYGIKKYRQHLEQTIDVSEKNPAQEDRYSEA